MAPRLPHGFVPVGFPPSPPSHVRRTASWHCRSGCGRPSTRARRLGGPFTALRGSLLNISRAGNRGSKWSGPLTLAGRIWPGPPEAVWRTRLGLGPISTSTGGSLSSPTCSCATGARSRRWKSSFRGLRSVPRKSSRTGALGRSASGALRPPTSRTLSWTTTRRQKNGSILRSSIFG